MPVYFTGGKRVQPFGVFESLFINDSITQDLYEINKTGATIGFAKEDILGLDLSMTLYKGGLTENRAVHVKAFCFLMIFFRIDMDSR